MVAERLRDLLRESIGKRMMTDVPFGVFLSGGVDSSTNVALMAELMRRAGAHVLGRASQGTPQLRRARSTRARVAERFGTDHHEVVDRRAGHARLPARAGLPPGRAARRLDCRPAALRLRARARDRHDRRPGRRGRRRALPRLPPATSTTGAIVVPFQRGCPSPCAARWAAAAVAATTPTRARRPPRRGALRRRPQPRCRTGAARCASAARSRTRPARAAPRLAADVEGIWDEADAPATARPTCSRA